MEIGYKKRVPRGSIPSAVAKMIIRNNYNHGDRIELRRLVRERDWDAAKILSHLMGVEIHGDPSKFKSVVLEKLAQKGCKTIW